MDNAQALSIMEELHEQLDGIFRELHRIDPTDHEIHDMRVRLARVGEAMECWMDERRGRGYSAYVKVTVDVPVTVWAKDDETAQELAEAQAHMLLEFDNYSVIDAVLNTMDEDESITEDTADTTEGSI